MANTDCFTFATSQLNPFLFAEVGTEANGSALTVLSLLARQGKDAWAEAASWVRLPRADVIATLARSIAAAPLAAPDHDAAPATAARLVLLLPERGQATAPQQPRHPAAALLQGTLPARLPMRLLYVACAIVLGVNLLFAHRARPVAPAPLAPLSQPAANSTHKPSLPPGD